MHTRLGTVPRNAPVTPLGTVPGKARPRVGTVPTPIRLGTVLRKAPATPLGTVPGKTKRCRNRRATVGSGPFRGRKRLASCSPGWQPSRSNPASNPPTRSGIVPMKLLELLELVGTVPASLATAPVMRLGKTLTQAGTVLRTRLGTVPVGDGIRLETAFGATALARAVQLGTVPVWKGRRLRTVLGAAALGGGLGRPFALPSGTAWKRRPTWAPPLPRGVLWRTSKPPPASPAGRIGLGLPARIRPGRTSSPAPAQPRRRPTSKSWLLKSSASWTRTPGAMASTYNRF